MPHVFAQIAGLSVCSPVIQTIDDLYVIPRSCQSQEWKPNAQQLPMLLRRRLSTCGKAVASTLLSFPESCDETHSAWVFASRYGDIENTLTQLREIAHDRPISPTTFATHVHNGIGGLIAIAAKHHGYQTSLAGHNATVSQALCSAIALLRDYPHVFLSFYDGVHATSDVPAIAATLHLTRANLRGENSYRLLTNECFLITEFKAEAKGLNPPLGPASEDSQAEIYHFLAWLLQDNADFTWAQNHGFWVTTKNKILTPRRIRILCCQPQRNA